jgi:olefin beta-lactone synthetase
VNVADAIHHLAANQPTLAAVEEMGGQKRTESFQQLSNRIATLATALLRSGLEPGDRVVLLVSEPLDFIASVFALFHAGLVPVLIDPGMGLQRMLRCVAQQRPRGLLGIRKAAVLRSLFRPSFKSVAITLCTDGAFPGAHSVPKLIASLADGPRIPPAQHTPAVGAVLFTSGSTGAPKGVAYSQAMITAQADAIASMFGIQPGQRDVACFLPFGLFSVAMGMTTIFPDMDFRAPAKANPQKIADALRDATSAFASPALWTPFVRAAKAAGWQFPLLKRVLTAGAPVSPSLHRDFLSMLPNGDVFPPYGATEALPVAFVSGRLVVQETASITERGGGTCVGTTAPHVRVLIMTLREEAVPTMGDAVLLPAGEMGEIIVAGPAVTEGYDGMPEATARSKILDDDGTIWHRMGDVGYLDDQGRLWFCGRVAHRVVKADETLHSIPIEAQAESLLGHKTRAALVGVGARGSQRAVVLLEQAGDVTISNDDVALVKKLSGVDDVMIHMGALPVDRRHNAKIEREQLAVWAAARLSNK